MTLNFDIPLEVTSALRMFGFEIFDDEALASRAVAFPDFAAIEADRTAWQEHDADAVVIGNVAGCLTWLAGLALGHYNQSFTRAPGP